ncbi:hypothetical protein SAMN04515647_1599 [Cohaesibacter sp. ES.047]|uniref:hypothetical protein n=1 Tax=Cohaesibacter sp. ES.047 TaxID=1798205 RepID=UPI000BB7BAD8|nr:hypothetical protein [Cohaesibacter sp. ES.047]SNY91377.1 hypothetical protein SAMN04515647_1599 [Cohaesibacter sp. ES.047]
MNDVKPAFASKINWTAILGAAAGLGTVFGLDIDPALQAKIVATTSAVSSAAIVVWRTWYTSKKVG